MSWVGVMVEMQVAQRLAGSGTSSRPAERAGVAAALAAGLCAGTALLAMLLATAAAIYDEPPWKILRMMAATVRGEAALSPEGSFNIAIATLGIAMHYALSLLYALAFAGLVADVRRWLVPWAGLAFGVALYYVNLHGFTYLFPWFAELRTPDTLIAHALFGLLLARAYGELSRA